MAEAEDVILRRELRRRKILENSDARWKTIMGFDKKESLSGAELKSSTLPVRSNTLPEQCILDDYSSHRKHNFQVRGTYSDSAISHVLNNCVVMAEPISNKDQLEIKQKLSNEDVRKEKIARTEVKERSRSNESGSLALGASDKAEASANGTVRQRPSASHVYAFPKKVSDAETRSYGRTRADTRRSSSCTQLMMETLQLSSLSRSILRPWLVMIAAILASICSNFDSKLPIPQSIFLPFLLSEVAIYSWANLSPKAGPRSPSHTLIGAALLLCGVSPSVVSKASSISNIIYDTGRDFAIYLFSFVVFNVLCEDWM